MENSRKSSDKMSMWKWQRAPVHLDNDESSLPYSRREKKQTKQKVLVKYLVIRTKDKKFPSNSPKHSVSPFYSSSTFFMQPEAQNSTLITKSSGDLET